MPVEPERLKILTRELVAHEDANQTAPPPPLLSLLLHSCLVTHWQGMPRKAETAGVDTSPRLALKTTRVFSSIILCLGLILAPTQNIVFISEPRGVVNLQLCPSLFIVVHACAT
jgi:hypothetical protein